MERRPHLIPAVIISFLLLIAVRQLARELGVSASYLSQVKNGKRPPSRKVLSRILNIIALT